MNLIKSILKALLSLMPEKTRNSLYLARMRRGNSKVIQAWEDAGKPMTPPHAVKQELINEYRLTYGCNVLVETGTYLGDMVMAQIDRFDQIYSIELSKELAQQAEHRFRNYPHVHIRQGDSGKQLASLLQGVSGKVLFWLDGHYSAGITAKGDTDCPVPQELRAILSSGIKDPVILIDDAREFTGLHDYPSIEQIEAILQEFNFSYELQVADDTIRITPRA